MGEGIVLRLLGLTHYDFTSLGASEKVTFRVAVHVDVSRYTQGILVARVHSGSLQNGATVDAEAYVDGWTDEDPTADFQGASLGSVSLSSVPDVGVKELPSSSMANTIMVELTFTQGSQGSVTFDPAVSIDLNLKSA